MNIHINLNDRKQAANAVEMLAHILNADSGYTDLSPGDTWRLAEILSHEQVALHNAANALYSAASMLRRTVPSSAPRINLDDVDVADF